MDRTESNEKGFAFVEILLVIVVSLLLIGTGYVVFKRVDRQGGVTLQQPKVYTEALLASHQVSLKVPSGWTIATGGYGTIPAEQGCHPANSAEVDCIDTARLYSTYIKPDPNVSSEFSVRISVFRYAGEKSLPDWVNGNGLLGQYGIQDKKASARTINGSDLYQISGSIQDIQRSDQDIQQPAVFSFFKKGTHIVELRMEVSSLDNSAKTRFLSDFADLVNTVELL